MVESKHFFDFTNEMISDEIYQSLLAYVFLKYADTNLLDEFKKNIC